MTTQVKLIAGMVALIVAFLVGFVPQYRTASALRNELRVAQGEAESLRSRAQVAELRDLIGLAYLESSSKNFGVARQHASQLFTRAGEIAAETADEDVKTLLGEVLGMRDRIIGGLAEGSGAVQTDLEQLARLLYANAMK